MSTKKQQYIAQIMQSGEQMGVESIAFHASAADTLGLNLSDTKALSILLAKGRITASELARLTNLTPGAVTSMLDRLAEQGFVYRTPDTHDGRKVVVELNYRKMQTLQALYAPMITDMTKLLNGFNSEELQTIAAYQQQAVELMQRHTLTLQLGVTTNDITD